MCRFPPIPITSKSGGFADIGCVGLADTQIVGSWGTPNIQVSTKVHASNRITREFCGFCNGDNEVLAIGRDVVLS